MTNTRAISYPVVLTQPEMAFLLSLVGAQTLEGLEHEALFPENAGAWESLFLQGRSELERDQWLIQVPGTAQHDLNEHLVTVIAAMAAPRFVVVTTLDRPGLPRQSVTHYISNVVVEACFDGKQYQLAGVRSTEVMLARLANTIGLPQERATGAEFELTAEQARQAIADPQTARLLAFGVPSGCAQAFENVLRDTRTCASVRITSMHYGEIKAVHRLQALISNEDLAWLAVPEDDTRVHFSLASAKDFVEMVQAFVQTP